MGVQVGAAIVATRFVVGEVGPATLAGLRYAIGLVTLLPFVLHFLWRTPQRTPITARELPRMALLGVGQFALLIALLNIGLQTVPAAQAALLFACFPLLTLLVAAALGHERLNARNGLGTLLTLGGVAVAFGPGVLAGSTSLAGALAVLASALCGAVCSVLYRPVLQRHPVLPVSAVAMAAAVLFLAVWAPFEAAASRIALLSPTAWRAIAFIGASSGIGYFLWLWALRHASASRVTLFLSLSPLTALLLGAVWLGEPLVPRLLVAVALVAIGLRIAQEPST